MEKESVKVLKECIDLQLRKANDYQNPSSTIRQADYYPNGCQSIFDSMHAKVLRMRSVMEAMSNDPNYTPNFESLEDSARDLINYTSFYVAYMRGKIDGQQPDRDWLNKKNAIKTSHTINPVPIRQTMYKVNFVTDVRETFKTLLRAEHFVTDKTGCRMLELRSASFIADEFTIFGKPNEDYIRREIEWYMSCSRNVNDIPGEIPTIWKQVATKDGLINSNYGWCVFSFENGNQFHRVENELREKPDSRRAVMIYNRPSMWDDYNRDGMSDFMCTNAVQYFIRDGRLEAHVQMRSNDVVYGFRNDVAWQHHVQKLLAKKLEVQIGDIFWNVGSLHIYERHFHLVK